LKALDFRSRYGADAEFSEQGLYMPLNIAFVGCSRRLLFGGASLREVKVAKLLDGYFPPCFGSLFRRVMARGDLTQQAQRLSAGAIGRPG